MELQTTIVLRRPVFGLSAAALTALLALAFLYFDQFYFITPYFVVLFPPDRIPVLVLDILISALSGVVLTVSAYEVRTLRSSVRAFRRPGLAGIAAAFVAGACPCYYLLPLLAATGGVGGILATFGILLFDYQVPIKLGSLALLGFSTFTLERSLRAACEVPAETSDIHFSP